MSNYKLICHDQKRRRQVRKLGLNGLDYLEVSDDQRRLSLYFINAAPKGLTKGNFRIDGGERITEIEVINVDYGCSDEPDPTVDVCVQLTVNKPGDFSTYNLCWVERDVHDRPTKQRAKGADPVYACLEFSFKAGCPNGLDCGDNYAGKSLPPSQVEETEINYLAKDYASFRQLILDRLALVMPNWKEQHVPDIGTALVEALAYTGDYLSYYQDAVATEAYLETARQRISVRRHARLVDYLMHEGCNARTWLCLETRFNTQLSLDKIYFITGHNDRLRLEGGTIKPRQLHDVPPQLYEVFHPLLDKEKDVQLYRDHNEIQFYTWGNEQCYLPEGTTNATMKGRLLGEAWRQQKRDSIEAFVTQLPDDVVAVLQETWKDLKREKILNEIMRLDNKELDQLLETAIKELEERHHSGIPEEVLVFRDLLKSLNETTKIVPTLYLDKEEILILEEITGPETGNPADADPKHRQAVRLTHVRQEYDPVYKLPVVEIEWAAADALTFPLCLSVIGPPPRCELIENLSVARANVILVDHGRWVHQAEPLGEIPIIQRAVACEDMNDPEDTSIEIGRLKPPRLRYTPISHRQVLSTKDTPACQMLSQDPRQALPEVQLTSAVDFVPDFPPDKPSAWQPQRDLLGSGPLDQHFVVEIDNEGCGHIRFGDGVHGQMPQPDPDKELYAAYRIGNGLSGNVGAESISYAVTDADVYLKVRNPMPAQGGIQPETMESVKLFAPGAFRSELMRAVIPDDYVWLAERYPDRNEASWRKVVQRAAAAGYWIGGGFEIVLAIDPLTESLRVSHEDAAKLLKKIDTYIQRYRRIGHDVRVEFAHYVPLDIKLCVTVLPGYFKGHVKAELINVFSNQQLPDGRLGFFHPDNLTFGDGICVSRLVSTAQMVTGVESAWVTRLQRMFDPEPDPVQNSITEGLLRMSPLEIAQVDNNPSRPEYGQITFSLEGGR